jgi:hypothetical protein
MSRVWIVYQPHLYADVWARVFESLGSVEVVEHPFAGVDVIVFPLDDSNQPRTSLVPKPLPDAKLVAISPAGDFGLVRLPGDGHWRKVQPFGLNQLCLEVQAGRAAPVDIPHPVNRPSAAMPVAYSAPTTQVQPRQPRMPTPLAWLIPLRQWAPHWAITLTALIVVYFMTVGTLATSRQSLPGEVLYPVKRWAESAQLAFASEAQQPKLQAEFAERRLDEIEALAERGIVLPDLLEDMINATQAALDSATRLRQDADRQALLSQLAELTRHQQVVLSLMQAQVSNRAQTVLRHAWQASIEGHEEAISALRIRPGILVLAEGTQAPIGPILNDTPSPTATPASTGTEAPTETRTSMPSVTPAAPGTATPTPSATPFPTIPSTLTPSRTPTRTETPAPTPALP